MPFADEPVFIVTREGERRGREGCWVFNASGERERSRRIICNGLITIIHAVPNGDIQSLSQKNWAATRPPTSRQLSIPSDSRRQNKNISTTINVSYAKSLDISASSSLFSRGYPKYETTNHNNPDAALLLLTCKGILAMPWAFSSSSHISRSNSFASLSHTKTTLACRYQTTCLVSTTHYKVRISLLYLAPPSLDGLVFMPRTI